MIVLQRWLSQTGQEAAFREWLAAEALASSVHIESVLDWILSLCVHPAAARGPAPFVAREQRLAGVSRMACHCHSRNTSLSYKAALPFVLIAFAVTLLSPSGGEAQPRPAAAPAGAAPLAMVARRKTHPFREGASLKAPGAG